jgi:hypothetical protein
MCLPYQVGDTTAPFVRMAVAQNGLAYRNVDFQHRRASAAPHLGHQKAWAQTEIAATRERCSYLTEIGFPDANPVRTFDVRVGEYRGGL